MRRFWAVALTVWTVVTFAVTLVLAYQDGLVMGVIGLLLTALLARCAWILWHPGASAPAPQAVSPAGPERPWRSR